MKNQTKIEKESRHLRISSLRGMIGSKGLTLRQVCEKAGYDDSTIRSQLSQLSIGTDRLNDLEEAAQQLPSKYNLINQPATANS
jgi:hypothetical protein